MKNLKNVLDAEVVINYGDEQFHGKLVGYLPGNKASVSVREFNGECLVFDAVDITLAVKTLEVQITKNEMDNDFIIAFPDGQTVIIFNNPGNVQQSAIYEVIADNYNS